MQTADVGRSSFVTVLAWVGVAFGGLATLGAVLQNLMFFLVFPQADIQRALADPKAPASAALIFGSMRWVLPLFLVMACTTLLASLGLLWRKEWARRTFIGLLGLSIVWSLLGILMQQFLIADMQPDLQGAPDDFARGFEIMFTVMRVVSALMAIGMAVFCAWLIKRLCSEPIRREFSALR